MKVLAFNGSPRRDGNTSCMLREFMEGARGAGADVEEIITDNLDLQYCRGCLKCNLLERCRIKGDDWEAVSRKILEAHVLVFASPVYFHHVTASMKKLLDRFRSFIHVRIIEEGLDHTPWHVWNKDFVLLLPMGSSKDDEARPIIELFEFITSVLGSDNRLHSVTATRLAAAGQVGMSEEELRDLYPKLKLPVHLVMSDIVRNQDVLKHCRDLGGRAGSSPLM